jgi:hypothetical protein
MRSREKEEAKDLDVEFNELVNLSGQDNHSNDKAE